MPSMALLISYSPQATFARETPMETVDDPLENKLDCNNLGTTERTKRTNV
jgi:hypothetical protein